MKEGSKCKEIFLGGDQNLILGGQIYKFTYFKMNFKTFGGTFVSPPMHVGPPLPNTMFTLVFVLSWGREKKLMLRLFRRKMFSVEQCFTDIIF